MEMQRLDKIISASTSYSRKDIVEEPLYLESAQNVLDRAIFGEPKIQNE